jgi:hypothetical protein
MQNNFVEALRFAGCGKSARRMLVESDPRQSGATKFAGTKLW